VSKDRKKSEEAIKIVNIIDEISLEEKNACRSSLEFWKHYQE
jgi:hypothetical protein